MMLYNADKFNITDLKNLLQTSKFADGTAVSEAISGFSCNADSISFVIEILPIQYKEAHSIREQAIALLTKTLGVKIKIILTNKPKIPMASATNKTLYKPDNIRKIIAIAAGKGGVGKSTMTIALADNLRALGKKVGVVDADIYGPSIPVMLGNITKPVIENQKLIPLEARGLYYMSIGLLTKLDGAIAWRGPMITKAIHQLLTAVAWPELDYLLIDMPPGTGDVHLTILENYQLDGVVIVTTPQQVAFVDVDKAIDLYQKFAVPIIGLIENMSYFLDSLGQKIQLFPGSAAETLQAKYAIAGVEKIALQPAISAACDKSTSLGDFIKLDLVRHL